VCGCNRMRHRKQFDARIHDCTHARSAWLTTHLLHCYQVKDLGSLNGTFLNGVRIHSATVVLAHGDLLKFGLDPRVFRLHSFDSSPSPPPSRPPPAPSRASLREGSSSDIAALRDRCVAQPTDGVSSSQQPSLDSGVIGHGGHCWWWWWWWWWWW
jgi:hypothetical protein